MDPITLSSLVVYGAVASLPVGLVALALALATHERKRTLGPLAAGWREAAAALGLSPAGERTTVTSWRLGFEGEVDGRAVRVEVDLRTVDTAHEEPVATALTLRARLWAPLYRQVRLTRENEATETLRYAVVEDVTLGHALVDDRLHVSARGGAGEALQALAAGDAGRAVLTGLANDADTTLVQGWLIRTLRSDAGNRASTSPAALEATLQAALEAAQRFDDAVLGGLLAFSETRGLLVDGTDGWIAQGTVARRAVTLRLDATSPRLEVAMGEGAPTGLVVARSGPLVKPNVRIANPVLSRLVGAVADDPEAVALRLADDAATEAVLAVVEGRPGSRVRDGRVSVALGPAPSAEEVDAALEEALALARVFDVNHACTVLG